MLFSDSLHIKPILNQWLISLKHTMKGVTIWSLFAVLVAVNAGVVPKKQTVTTQEIRELFSDALDLTYKLLKEREPFNIHESFSFNLKSTDFDLTMEMSDLKAYLGDVKYKSVTSNIDDSTVTGGVELAFQGYNIIGKHTTNGTVKGRAYNIVGDVTMWHNYEGIISFAASYDDSSVTLESIDWDTRLTNSVVKLSGLPFNQVVQEKITSLVTNDELIQMNNHITKELILAKDKTKESIKFWNRTYAGATLQEVYDEFRQRITNAKN